MMCRISYSIFLQAQKTTVKFLEDFWEHSIKQIGKLFGNLNFFLVFFHPINLPLPTDLNDYEQKVKKYDQYILGSLKNGKLHGLVQIYGKLTADPEGHCSSRLFKGLSFVGWFEEGKPVGPHWRALLGETYLYGVMDENGEFTGPDIAFIYQDLELALVGEFQKGLMVSDIDTQKWI